MHAITKKKDRIESKIELNAKIAIQFTILWEIDEVSTVRSLLPFPPIVPTKFQTKLRHENYGTADVNFAQVWFIFSEIVTAL